jgi:hypothetical protein
MQISYFKYEIKLRKNTYKFYKIQNNSEMKERIMQIVKYLETSSNWNTSQQNL